MCSDIFVQHGISIFLSTWAEEVAEYLSEFV